MTNELKLKFMEDNLMTQSLFEYIIIFKLKSKNNNYIQNFIYRIDLKNVNKSISHKIICFLSFIIKRYL